MTKLLQVLGLMLLVSQVVMAESTDEIKKYTFENLYNAGHAVETEEYINIVIDGSAVKSVEEIHSMIKSALHLPIYYGKNLDALFDVLSDTSIISKPVDITIIEVEAMKSSLGTDSVHQLLIAIRDASRANSLIELNYEK